PPFPLSVPERGDVVNSPSPEGRGGQGVRTTERGSGGEDRTPTQPVLAKKGAVTGAKQDTTVVNALIARLKDDNAGVRRAAAHSLGQLGDPRAVQPLITVLADSDAEVRSAAVDALANLEDPRAIGPIAGLLKDPVADVKHTALSA